MACDCDGACGATLVLPEVDEVRRLVVRPGDVLLVRVDKVHDGVVGDIRRVLRDAMPDDVPILIHNGSVDVSVVAPEEVP